MKLCKSCETEKPESEFYSMAPRANGTCGLRVTCKTCDIARSAKQREGDKREAYLAYQKVYQSTTGRQKRAERFAWYNQLKSNPCEDCNTLFPPECMDFDHIDPSTKLFCVSYVVLSGRSEESVRAEIAKCRLICANCHRIRTAVQQRRGGGRKKRAVHTQCITDGPTAS